MKRIGEILLYQGIAASAAFNINSIHHPLRHDTKPYVRTQPRSSFLHRVSSHSTTALHAKDDDVNELFAAYMAQRQDKPLFSETSSNAKDASESDDKEAESAPKKRWAPGKRLKNMLYSSSTSEPNFVKPISLGKPVSDAGNTEQDKSNDASTKPPNPPSFLQNSDLESINTTLEKFTNDMQEKLDKLRTENPESVPSNANEILQQVVEQRRAYELQEINEQRAMESFDKYEERMKRQMESKQNNINNEVEDDLVVKEIIEEAEKTNELNEKRQEEIRNFKEYEESLKKDLRRRSESIGMDQSYAMNVQSPTESQPQGQDISFEELELKALENLLERRNQAAEDGGFDDEDIYLTDNIEDGIRELRTKIATSASIKNSSKPESLKDWQMYRSIATKLANEKRKRENFEGDNDSNLSDQLSEDSDEIQSKLEAWKDFQRKEEEMRAKSGLTIKYRLPFEWSDKPDVDQEESKLRRKGPIDVEKAEEARSEMDDLALQVLTNLMTKTEDAMRKEKLRNEIEALKEGIRTRHEALKNRGPVVVKEKKIVPITISDVLNPKQNSNKKIIEEDKRRGTIISDEADKLDGNSDEEVDEKDDFDEDDVEDDEIVVDEMQDVAPPPDSEFFRDIADEREPILLGEDAEEQLEDEVDEAVPSLGTLEQQKFRSLVARSGVRTVEAQNELKEQWEDFQRAENKMRELAGLSVGSDAASNTAPTPKVDYDVNTIFNNDGDIDFDKVFSSIGKRPSRKNKGTAKDSTEPLVSTSNLAGISSKSEESTTETAEDSQEVLDSDSSADTNSIIDSQGTEVKSSDKKVSEPVSTRGSLTFGDDHTREAERKFLSSQFSGFEQRKSDLLDYKILSVSQVDSLVGLKSSPYSSGVSPYLAKMNKPFKDYGAIFSLEGVLVDATGFYYNAWIQTANSYAFSPPSIEDVRLAAVHHEEFAVQRIFYWTDDVFTARKIAKTYREARKAIFDDWDTSGDTEVESEISDNSSMSRLDELKTDDGTKGIETDIARIQLVAWERAAKSYGFQPPTIDLLNIVGTLKPDEAVRTVFHWSKDYIVSSDVGNAYRKYLKEETSKWLKKEGADSGLTRPISNNNVLHSNGQNAKRSKAPSVEDVLSLKQKAWENALKNGDFGFNPPTIDEIQVVEFAGLERAISSIFKWDTIPEQDDAILTDYREQLKALTQEWMNSIEDPGFLAQPQPQEDASTSDLPLFLVKDGVEQWLIALEDIHVPCALISHMENELVNKVLEVTKLSRFFQEENRISSSAGYDSEMQQLLGGALRLERRPDHCIVFSATPQSAAVCHEVEMKNVAIVSPYPYFELTASDMTVRDFGSIGVRNLKNVFSETSMEDPMEQIEVEGPQIRKQTMLKTRFWDEGDR